MRLQSFISCFLFCCFLLPGIVSAQGHLNNPASSSGSASAGPLTSICSECESCDECPDCPDCMTCSTCTDCSLCPECPDCDETQGGGGETSGGITVRNIILDGTMNVEDFILPGCTEPIHIQNRVKFHHDITLQVDSTQFTLFPYLNLDFELADTSGTAISGTFLGNTGSKFLISFDFIAGTSTVPYTVTYASNIAHLKFSMIYESDLPINYPIEDLIDIHMSFATLPSAKFAQSFVMTAKICQRQASPQGPGKAPSSSGTGGRLSGPETSQEGMFDAFALFPNPFQNQLSLKNTSNGLIRFSLSDIQGRIIQQSNWLDGGSTQHWHLSHLSPGMYIVQIEGELGQKVVQKIIKQ